MKILLFGSIASGKTTIAKKVLQKHSSFKYIAIDDFRRKYGDDSMKYELISQRKFLEQIGSSNSSIIEASGVGKLGDDILNVLLKQKDNILIVVLYLSETAIKERLKERVWDTPFPCKQDKIDDIILSINHSIEFGRIQMMWLEKENTTILQIENKDLNTQEFILATINNYLKMDRNDTE